MTFVPQPQRLKPVPEGKGFIAALKRCATQNLRNCGAVHAALSKLDLAVIVIIVPILMAQVLHRAQGAAVFGVTDLDSSIYILQFDSRAAACKFSTEVVA